MLKNWNEIWMLETDPKDIFKELLENIETLGLCNCDNEAFYYHEFRDELKDYLKEKLGHEDFESDVIAVQLLDLLGYFTRSKHCHRQYIFHTKDNTFTKNYESLEASPTSLLWEDLKHDFVETDEGLRIVAKKHIEWIQLVSSKPSLICRKKLYENK